MLFALVDVGDQESPVSDLGVNTTWNITFKFLRDDLLNKLLDFNTDSLYGADLVPETGDIIQYQNGYFEVDNTNTKQYFAGKDPDYPYGVNPLNPNLQDFGYNVSVVCETHYIPADRINIIKQRL
jgi:signal peptidase I